MKVHSGNLALVSAAVLAMVLAAGAQAASSQKKSHSSAAPIPTGKDAKFTVDQITFYGYFDNSPPGLAIAHPVVHGGAGGHLCSGSAGAEAGATRHDHVHPPPAKVFHHGG